MSEDKQNWIQKRLTVKPGKAIVKLYNNDTFLKSIIIPTVFYPLPREEVRTFHGGNCENIVDENIIRIFDNTDFEMGRCFENVLRLADALRKEGYDAKTYAGWLFFEERYTPSAHAWVVLGDSVLDLSDHFSMFERYLGNRMSEMKTKKDMQGALVDFYADAKRANLAPSKRCGEVDMVGVPSTEGSTCLLYIGCEVPPMEAKEFYFALKERFPNHEAWVKTTSTGLTETQDLINKAIK